MIGQRSQWEAIMLKAIILGCALCLGTSGTVFWVASSGHTTPHSAVVAMPSALEMHANAHMDNLQVQTY
jgi:hypothetical protein